MIAAPVSYGESLRELGRECADVIVIDAGLATSMQTELFADAFPDRYFNIGIAEQNAVGVASGLARRGFIPLVHTFSNFLARRAHDQVAVAVAWPGCNVKLIGGSCGIFDGRNGPSHLATDDLAVMSSLPGIMIAEPGDQRQTHELLRRVVHTPGPAYLRLRRHGSPIDLLPATSIDSGTVVVAQSSAASCTLVVGGSLLGEAQLAAQILADARIPVDLLQVPIMRPLDSIPIVASARTSRFVVTVENHVACGGLGDAVARVIGPLGIRQCRLTLPDQTLPAGDPAWLLNYCSLDASSLATRVSALLEEHEHV